VQEKISLLGLDTAIRATVPKSKIACDPTGLYTRHEIACVDYLAKQGFTMKMGPSQEKKYDCIIKRLGIQMGFLYIADALALGTKTPDKVVHYAPNSKGPNNGQRLFLEDSEQEAMSKLETSCDSALRAIGNIAHVSAIFLDRKEKRENLEEISGEDLKKKVKSLFHDHLFSVYKEVM
jgi:hypothetical protein